MKLGISAYSYSGAFSDDFTLADAILHAKKTGFEGIEFLSGTKWKNYSALDTMKFLNQKCSEEGLQIFCYSGGVNFNSGDDKDNIKNVKSLIDEAYVLGATNVRCDTVGWNFADVGAGGIKHMIEHVSENIKIAADYASEKGINLLVENHGKIMQDSLVVEQLINTVNRENYGALVDIGNFMCADESSVHGVGRMARYAKHVHLKDFYFKDGNEVFLPTSGWFETRGQNHLRGAILGHGVVPVYQCLKILDSYGYNGTVCLEYEGIENTLSAIEESFRVMQKAIKVLDLCKE